jgi:uncharacterized protein (DUF1810 family)
MAMPTTMNDPFNLARFVDAQDATYAAALAEIRRGQKRSHWMWFVFPQLTGLGSSPMAVRYSIRSSAEAVAYLAHPLLGVRYRECVAALQDVAQAEPEAVFGPVDARKLHSSLTLFQTVQPEQLFAEALDRWFKGRWDQQTLEMLKA